MRRKIFDMLVVIGLVLLIVVSWTPAQATAPETETTAPAITRYEAGYRYDQYGWTFLHIEGEPYTRGYQHGYLLADQLAEVVRYNEGLSMWETGQDWQYFVDEAERQFVPRLDEEYLEEIKGIADGAQAAGTEITWQQVLAWNGANDLEAWYPLAEEGNSPAGNGHCSAFAATGTATAGGKIVIAHNSWDSYTRAGLDYVLLDIVPSAGHRVFMQSSPGLIDSGTDYFVNDAGLMGTETTIACFSAYDANGAPEFFRARKAMQYAETADEFVEIMLVDNNGGYANSWLLGDAKTGEIVRFELGLKYHSVSKLDDGYFIGFNGVYDSRIRNLECDYGDSFSDVRTQVGARRVRLTQLMEENLGNIDVDAAKRILADTYDVYLDLPNHPSAHTVDGHYELDPRNYFSYPGWWPLPYQPEGALDGKVMDSEMAADLAFWARTGGPGGIPFDADVFLAEHPQWDQYRDFLPSRPSEPWALFAAGAEAAAEISVSPLEQMRNALYGEWTTPEEGLFASVEFRQDGSVLLGAAGQTIEANWHLSDPRTLAITAATGSYLEFGVLLEDGNLVVSRDDVSSTFTRAD